MYHWTSCWKSWTCVLFHFPLFSHHNIYINLFPPWGKMFSSFRVSKTLSMFFFLMERIFRSTTYWVAARCATEAFSTHSYNTYVEDCEDMGHFGTIPVRPKQHSLGFPMYHWTSCWKSWTCVLFHFPLFSHHNIYINLFPPWGKMFSSFRVSKTLSTGSFLMERIFRSTRYWVAVRCTTEAFSTTRTIHM